MDAERWLVVLGTDAVVLAVDGGAPEAWTGRRIEAIDALPEALRTAGRALVERSHHPESVAPRSCRGALTDDAGTHAVDIVAIEALPMQRVKADLRRVLTSAMQGLDRQAEASEVELAVEVEGDGAVEAWIDPEKIAWAVTTLVGNAFRYVRRGTRRMPGGTIVVRLEVDEPAGAVLVSVQDDGPGIPPDKVPWLFRREEGKPVAAGLSLMLIHDVVAAHGGSIDVKSATEGPDRGTTITLRIPSR